MAKIIPPCSYACPVQTDVRGYISAISEKDFMAAYSLIRQNNPFPSACAWVCSHPCEESCRRKQVDSPLAIRSLKRFITEMFQAKTGAEKLPVKTKKEGGKNVGIIGAGPSGLTAALDLVRQGHAVTVFEKNLEPGGHFALSLPTYRLPERILRQDIEEIRRTGVEIKTSLEIGKDISFTEIAGAYDAVIIATGLQLSKRLDLPGFNHPGILPALPFLQAARRNKPLRPGREVIVIGGGDVAIDAARIALRLGAHRVSVVCLEKKEEMPSRDWEIKEATEEGINFIPGWGPSRVIIAGENIFKLEVVEARSVYDEKGAFCPTFNNNRISHLRCDTIIVAIGQQADLSFLAGSIIDPGQSSRLISDKITLATNMPGVFACGEVADGPGPAIAAIASGHKVAASVIHYLDGQSFSLNRKEHEKIMVISSMPQEVASKIPTAQRQEPSIIDASARRLDFDSYEAAFNLEEALQEAARCLRCGLGAEVTEGQCSVCLNCLRSCPYEAPTINGAANGTAAISIENCQACGLCAAVCPANAISLQILPEGKIKNLLKEAHSTLVVFTCLDSTNWPETPERLIEAQGHKNFKLFRLPSTGALRLSWILEAIEKGAQGVAVITCRQEQCRFHGCLDHTRNLITRAKNLLEEIDLDPSLLLHCTI
jgi:formate dehydrogenase beta subunit